MYSLFCHSILACGQGCLRRAFAVSSIPHPRLPPPPPMHPAHANALSNFFDTVWDQVYGFDMSVIKEIALTEPLVDVVEGKVRRPLPQLALRRGWFVAAATRHPMLSGRSIHESSKIVTAHD